MDKFIVRGGATLSGSVAVSGAKNAMLELIPSTLLAPGSYTFTNAPDIGDVRTMAGLLEQMGATTTFADGILTIDTSTIRTQEAPYDLVKKMRASIHVLGPLVARFGHARVSLPGGCAWGPRPVDLHLKGLEKLGAEIEIVGGYIEARAERLTGSTITLDVSSVGATYNLMAAATLADGETTIWNAAMEPEVVAAGEHLIAMGAQIEGLGTSRVTITGVSHLSPAGTAVIPDRIEAGTLLATAAMTGSAITITSVNAEHIGAILEKLEQTGCALTIDATSITIVPPERLLPVSITTAIHPGFPTDMQAQWTAMMTQADGVSTVTDKIYHDRFSHIPELARLGCGIELHDNTATIIGGHAMTGATVMSTDLRASVAMVMAGMVAEGETEILRVYHLDRGYEALEKKLCTLGAAIERVETHEY